MDVLKKKKPKMGEHDSPDMKGSPSQNKEISGKAREAWMTLKDPKDANIGGLPTFGNSKTKSLARAMQENKTDNLADDLAKKLSDDQEKALRERARKRALGN